MDLLKIIASNLASYQAIFENALIDFLKQEGTSEKTLKNYRSDLRHFLSWSVLTIQSNTGHLPQSHLEFTTLITPHLLESYKHFLAENKIPIATINRRLSTMRIFCRACIARGWLSYNPATKLQNLTPVKPPKNEIEEVLRIFRNDLERDGASKVTIKNYASDVKQFLLWLQNQ